MTGNKTGHACLALVVGLLFGAGDLSAKELPDLKAGGAGGGPLAVLFLSSAPYMQKSYAGDLTRQGVVFTNASYAEPLKVEFLKKFNVIVLDRLPAASEEQACMVPHRMIAFRENLKSIRQCVEEGAGLLVFVTLDGQNGTANYGGWNEHMRPFGMQILLSCIRDKATGFEPWKQGETDCSYCWTENLVAHPVTEGLKRIYYVSANFRWDHCYSAPPLIGDENWTPIVRAMPGATAAAVAGYTDWIEEPMPAQGLVLAAVRTLGKGRIGVLSISSRYVIQQACGEMDYHFKEGLVLGTGDGNVRSDTGALISRMYAWLSGDSVAAGFGGFRTGEPVLKETVALSQDMLNFKPVVDFDTVTMPPSWRHRPDAVQVDGESYYPEVSDPLIKGELRYFKGLIGAHTALSDGRGSVADYAAAAKKAGYSVVVFTENFEKMSKEKYDKLVDECRRNTGGDFACVPGLDMADPDNNRFITVNPPYYPKASWLTADGKRIVLTHMLNLGYYNTMLVMHRPQTASAMPYERQKHFQGWAVYTYQGGKLADDSLTSYMWQVMNGSVPHPMAVHEVFAPDEVAEAARTGFQQILPADTVGNAVAYFNVASMAHFFECPARYLISEGPVVHTWVMMNKDIGPAAENRRHFRVDLGASSDVPLKSVTLYDGFTPIRRWLPSGTNFLGRADFQHSRQYGLFAIIEDCHGRRAVTPPMRTVAAR